MDQKSQPTHPKQRRRTTGYKKSRQMSLEKVYELLILSTDGYDRLEQLLHPFYRSHLSDDQLFTILRDEWTSFHNISDNLEELGEVFPLYGPVRAMMTPEENAAYDALPNTLTAHRGCDAGWLEGLCWSLNKKVANWFAFYPLTQAEEPTLMTARVEKSSSWRLSSVAVRRRSSRSVPMFKRWNRQIRGSTKSIARSAAKRKEKIAK
jgi:hypothetical protein